MNVAAPIQGINPADITAPPKKLRRASFGKELDIFADIHQKETNIAIWQRELSVTLQESVQALLASHPLFQADMIVTPQNVLSSIRTSLGATEQNELAKDIAALVGIFCNLFELQLVRLRLTTLDRAMCPKFHTDRVHCRLLTTYQGIATEWLPHHLVDRTKLGSGSNGLPDHQSGLYRSQNDIQQLHCGDVALLKGELWEGNKNAGLVHRSPTLPSGERRVLLRLDFID